MNIKKYIEKDGTLSKLHYLTVYQTIITLVEKGIIKACDLK